MLSDEAFERAIEWDMEQETKPRCERCGVIVEGSGDCGMEWDLNVCCFRCADELAFKDEQELSVVASDSAEK